MSDVLTKRQRSVLMASVRSTGNRSTELEMIRIFRKHRITGWRRGRVIRIQALNGSVRIRPDFLFSSRKTVVFVDGEFWHGHPSRCRYPKTRKLWWLLKIHGNRRRDLMQNRLLRKTGWTVIRVWEYELKTSAVLRKLKERGLF
jgi:DNA mismatch endonuclease (patch repair protein)